jgi:hypothetical protein
VVRAYEAIHHGRPVQGDEILNINGVVVDKKTNRHHKLLKGGQPVVVPMVTRPDLFVQIDITRDRDSGGQRAVYGRFPVMWLLPAGRLHGGRAKCAWP